MQAALQRCRLPRDVNLWCTRLTRQASGQAGGTTQTADEILDSLVNYEKHGIPANAGVASQENRAFDLGRMHRLLQSMGNPHTAWPVIHIAGSKGKGSTATMLSHVLHASGYRVGTYTSPHLHHLGERIQVGCSPLSPQQVDHLISTHADLLRQKQQEEEGWLTQFEAVTALAFKCFADEGVDVAVVETGMGGTTDATNVFNPSNLALSMITPLGLEHVEALGGSLESIAAAKAGILKPGVPVVVSRQQHSSALQVLLQEASKRGSEVVQAQSQVQVEHLGYQLLDTYSATVARELVRVSSSGIAAAPPGGAMLGPTELHMSMVGPHQHDNLAAVVAACQQLKARGLTRITHESMWAGLQRAFMPGRLQVLPLDTPLGSLAGGAEVATDAGGSKQPLYLVLDGAHSPEAAQGLSSSVRSLFPGAPVVLVVAMAADKEHRAVLEGLQAMQPSAVVFTTVPIAGSYHRAAAPGVLAAQWQAAVMLSSQRRRQRCRELIQASLQSALERGRRELLGAVAAAGESAGGVLVVTGSLHAVAAAQRLEDIARYLARAGHAEPL